MRRSRFTGDKVALFILIATARAIGTALPPAALHCLRISHLAHTRRAGQRKQIRHRRTMRVPSARRQIAEQLFRLVCGFVCFCRIASFDVCFRSVLFRDRCVRLNCELFSPRDSSVITRSGAATGDG